ncbi:MAG: cation-translocating P-type ATPase [Chloroflexota bacterium]|nr:MAG: cation-translocating P-type ATPase [Chloroflexota bacterium]
MLDRIVRYFQGTQNKRQTLVAASGTLIVLALASWNLLKLPAAGNILMVAAALVAGSDIALRAFRSLRNRYISIELLVTIATAGALVIGEYWEAAAVTFLFIFGAYLEARTLNRTRQVLGSLLDLAPTTAIVLRAGRQEEVLPHEVEQGETVLVKPGAKLPVDGEVIDGHSAVDESAITGEPMPEEKTMGSKVFAGTVNQNGLLYIRATGVGADTTLARIIRRVEEAQDEKAPTQRFIERFSRWYTPAIIVLSIIVYVISRDIELALTLLVISCPGALVISTPVSVVAGIGRAARAGILIKGGEYLENSGKISAIAMDKTGTLTQGKPRLTDILALKPAPVLGPVLEGAVNAIEGKAIEPGDGNLDKWSREQIEVLRWAAIAEVGSEHPLARAITTEADQAGLLAGDTLLADEFETVTGRGVRALRQGHEVVVGTQEFMSELGIAVDPEASAHLDGLKSAGKTAVLVAVDGFTIGVLGISDPIRDTASEMIKRLKKTGIRRIVMLTGDDRKTAQNIARQAGVDEVHAELLPEDKLEIIRSLQREGHVVAMVGDGINDAPALAAADIGIAMGAAGTDVAIETADIALMSDDLMKIPEAIHTSKAALRNIRQNVIIALATVTILLAGVLLGKVHMSGGMLVHEASVLVVIFNAMRLLKT